jgi:hypothetical protein
VTAFLTVILDVAFLPEPSAAVAVIVALPAFLAVTLPAEETVATFLLEVFHKTFLLLAFLGVTVAFNLRVFLTFKVAFFLFYLILVTGVPTVTVITTFFFLLAFV